MSQQANKVLADLLEDKEEGIPWEYAVREVEHACGVQSNTAEQYVRRSDEAVVDKNADGEKIVVPPSTASANLAKSDDEVVEMEVGPRNGRKFAQLPVLKEVGHPEVPRSHKDGYIRRRMTDPNAKSTGSGGLSRKTDVAVLTSVMADDDFSALLIGKHGVGKDRLVLHVCANTNRAAIRLVASDDPDFVDLLVGTYAPDENGNFARRKGLLQIALENGYTFILDEFNALSGKVQTMLNKILEDSNQNQLVIPETNQVIEPHDEFKFVATMNPNEVGYGGREDLDQATASRFVPIKLPPLDTSGEKKVVANETHWEEDGRELQTLLGDGGVVTGIRSMHDMGKTAMWVSTRDLIQIGRMEDRLGDLKAAAELVLVGRADPEQEDLIRDKINDTNW